MRIRSTGFVDLQVNGFAGVDFNAPDLEVEHALRALDAIGRTGVTLCLPTLITASLGGFQRNARLLARLRSDAVAGLHMEGPYLSREDGPRGAHVSRYLADASIDDFVRRQEAADGRIVLVTLAPEVPGALPLIEYLVQHGVRAAVGHTAATPRVIADAVSAGARLATHLGNGCAAMLPRHPNTIWELAAADDVQATLIVDGHHLPPSTVKVLVRAKTLARTMLVTDAMAAAAQPPGQYAIGDATGVLDASGRVTLPGTSYLAGSALTMPEAIANMVRFTGLALQSVLPMASAQPAAFLGLSPRGMVDADWDEGRLIVRDVIV